MSDLTQVKSGHKLIVGLIGISIYQALIIIGLSRKYERGRRRFNKLHEVMEYLLEVIHENNIELTEFDQIAITAIISEDK